MTLCEMYATDVETRSTHSSTSNPSPGRSAERNLRRHHFIRPKSLQPRPANPTLAGPGVPLDLTLHQVIRFLTAALKEINLAQVQNARWLTRRRISTKGVGKRCARAAAPGARAVSGKTRALRGERDSGFRSIPRALRHPEDESRDASPAGEPRQHGSRRVPAVGPARRQRRSAVARVFGPPLIELVDEARRETGSRTPFALERVSAHHHRRKRSGKVSDPRGEVARSGQAAKPSEPEAHVRDRPRGGDPEVRAVAIADRRNRSANLTV